MDKIKKFLRRLSSDERKIVEELVTALIKSNTRNLDLKKLKGHKNVYRVRSGSIRVIFIRETLDIKILELSRRNDKTYKNL